MNKNKTVTLQSTVLQNKNILSSNIDDEAILLCIRNSKYYGMNPIGSDIWNLLQEPIRIDELIKQLKEKYTVDDNRCAKDVIEFITMLAKKELVEIIIE